MLFRSIRREFIDIGIALSAFIPGLSRLGFIIGPLTSGFALWFIALGGIAALLAAIIKALKEFFAFQFQFAQLTASLQALGVNAEVMGNAFLDAGTALSEFGFRQTDVLASANDLVAATGNVSAALQGLSAAAKIAAADQISLQAATANVNTVL